MFKDTSGSYGLTATLSSFNTPQYRFGEPVACCLVGRFRAFLEHEGPHTWPTQASVTVLDDKADIQLPRLNYAKMFRNNNTHWKNFKTSWLELT